MEEHFLTGLIAAPFTPMDSNGDINPEVIQDYANWLIKTGVRGAFVCGTTGESASLSMEEKKTVIKEWTNCSEEDLKVIAHVGGTCQAECMELAEYASQNGADAVAAMAPYFFKPGNAHELLHFLKPIAASAPELPFYYYHIPSMTGVDIPVYTILEQAGNIIPTFAGVKYTHSDMMDLQQSIRVSGGRFELLFGTDEILISGLGFGIYSAVGSTYNYMAPVYRTLIKSFNDGDLRKAREQQQFSVQVVEIIIRHGGGVRGGKAIMELIGLDCGPCRSPLQKFSAEEKRDLKKSLSEIGFFEMIQADVETLRR